MYQSVAVGRPATTVELCCLALDLFLLLCSLQPVHHALHLRQERRLALCHMSILEPLEDGLLCQHIVCTGEESLKYVHRTHPNKEHTLVEQQHNLVEDFHEVHIVVAELLHLNE